MQDKIQDKVQGKEGTDKEREKYFLMQDYLHQKIVIDLHDQFICLGTLIAIEEQFIVVKNADFHDLRDTDTTRENYVAESLTTGIKRNRKKVTIFRKDIVAISSIEDCVDN